MKYKGIFFDFDYTLGDATEAIVAGYVYALHTMGYPIPTREEIRRSVGFTLEDGFTILTGDADPAKQALCRQLYVRVASPMQRADTPLFPGAAELLHALHHGGIKLAVISSKRHEILTQVLAQHNLVPLLTHIVGNDLVKKPKPDPEGILYVTNALGLDKSEVLFCGDTTIDGNAAKNAGVDFCAVLNGTTTAEEFSTLPHAYIAHQLADLQTWLLGS